MIYVTTLLQTFNSTSLYKNTTEAATAKTNTERWNTNF